MQKKSEEWIANLASKLDHGIRFGQYGSLEGVSVKVMTFMFGDVMEYTFSDYIEKNMTYNYALNDLKAQGMVLPNGDIFNEFTIIPIDGFSEPTVQSFGKQFLEFVKSPLK